MFDIFKFLELRKWGSQLKKKLPEKLASLNLPKKILTNWEKIKKFAKKLAAIKSDKEKIGEKKIAKYWQK